MKVTERTSILGASCIPINQIVSYSTIVQYAFYSYHLFLKEILL